MTCQVTFFMLLTQPPCPSWSFSSSFWSEETRTLSPGLNWKWEEYKYTHCSFQQYGENLQASCARKPSLPCYFLHLTDLKNSTSSGKKWIVKVSTSKVPCHLHRDHWGRLRLSIIPTMVRIPVAPFLFRLQLFQPSAISRLLRAAGMLQAIQIKNAWCCCLCVT